MLVFYLFYYISSKKAIRGLPIQGGFAVALHHAVQSSHPGHHIDDKGIPDANAATIVPMVPIDNVTAFLGREEVITPAFEAPWRSHVRIRSVGRAIAHEA